MDIINGPFQNVAMEKEKPLMDINGNLLISKFPFFIQVAQKLLKKKTNNTEVVKSQKNHIAEKQLKKHRKKR